MPTITYMSWNIENFGDGVGSPTRGNYWARCRFIARAARLQQADILALMELTQNGPPLLPLLRTMLYNAYTAPNDNWLYDWLPGAYAAGNALLANNAITANAQLNWEGPANFEGYALFWLHNPAKFTMLPAPPLQGAAMPANTQSNGVAGGLAGVPGGVPAHALTLVLSGRDPATVVGASPWKIQAPGVNPPGAYAWDDLDFPTPWVKAPIRNSCRRPCFCNVQVNTAGGAAAAVVPIVFYHAPSVGHGFNSSARGTQFAAFAQDMFQGTNPAVPWNTLYTNRVIASGDYNVNGNPPVLPSNRQQAYDSFTDPFGVGPANVGANCTARVPLGANISANATDVALNDFPGGPPIVSANTNDYRLRELDNVFYRGFAVTPVPPRGVVYDLLTAVRPGGSLTGAPVQTFIPQVTAAIAPPAVVMFGGRPVYAATGNPVYPQILHWGNFWAGLNAGQFPTARSAAEFIKLFVSDHLPVTFRFTVP